MNTLCVKLSTAMVVIVCAMGVVYHVAERDNTRAYQNELSQTLNAPVAEAVSSWGQLIVNGTPDLASLRDLAIWITILNPTAEIYLLDKQGAVLGHNMAANTAVSTQVDLQPLQEFLGLDATLPILGDNPRAPASRSVFSTAEIRSKNGLEGYLYVLFGSDSYQQLSSKIAASRAPTSGAMALAGIAGSTALFGFVVYSLLTRRLVRLNHEIDRVSESEFELLPKVVKSRDRRDEIDVLGEAFHDMSARIKNQIEQLKAVDHHRREFVSNISHDLRTPLAAIQGYLETLIVKPDLSWDERRHYLRSTHKHTVRLGTLISELFELSKLDAIDMSPNREVFSLAELVLDTAVGFQTHSENQNVDLTIDVNSAAFTNADVGLIQRVLENLLRNAFRFTSKGGKILVSITERDESVAVAVEDNGAGIAPEHLSKIFDRFYRVTVDNGEATDSCGLGLAIVKRILDLHGSQIVVFSELGAGARFEFELPLIQQGPELSRSDATTQ